MTILDSLAIQTQGCRPSRVWREGNWEMAAFHALGRNGNWPFVVAVDAGGTALLRAVLPLTVGRTRRDGVAELAARLNQTITEGRFIGPDRSGRMAFELTVPGDADGIRDGIDLLLQTVDRHLPGFFAVAGGAQTPDQAVDQMERRRIYA